MTVALNIIVMPIARELGIQLPQELSRQTPISETASLVSTGGGGAVGEANDFPSRSILWILAFFSGW